MSKRNRREHGRIISVETLTRGDSLAVDAAAGATSITVNDAGDFDEDGGWLYVGAQTVAYSACDDDTGVITLASALTAAAEQGDPIQVWSDLYGEVVDYQLALVELDGEYDNPDPVVAEVAEGVGDLPEGDRGKAGESCTLLRVADDEWEIVGVGGRARKSRSLRFEQDDTYVLTSGDITAASATMSLSKRPVDEGLTCYLAGVPQRPTNWTINYDAQKLTMPLSGWEKAGDRIWAHYAYRKGVATPQVPPSSWAISVADIGPWAWYKLNGDLTDSSGNARTATPTAWGPPTWGRPALVPSDPSGSAGQMVGGTGLITPTILPVAAGITVAFGYKGTAAGDPANPGYFFYQASGLHVARSTTGKVLLDSTDTGVPIATLADGAAHLIVVTIAPGSRIIEVDGTAVWSDTGSMPPSLVTGSFFWGYGAGSSAYRLEGDYDEIAIFDRPLSSDDRAALVTGWTG